LSLFVTVGLMLAAYVYLRRRSRRIANFGAPLVAFPVTEGQPQPQMPPGELPATQLEEDTSVGWVADGIDYAHFEFTSDGRYVDSRTGLQGAPSPDYEASYDELADFRAYLSTNIHYIRIANGVDYTHHVWVPFDNQNGGPNMVYMDARTLNTYDFPGLWNEPPTTGGSSAGFRESLRESVRQTQPTMPTAFTFPHHVFVSAAIAHGPQSYDLRRACRNAPRAHNIKEAALCKVCLDEVSPEEIRELASGGSST
jgi:hypothetical protein